MRTLTLDNAINMFVNKRIKGLQLDFFRENNEVLLQLFKGYDVVNWDIDYVVDYNDVVFCLHFHKAKTNNFINFERFLNSNISNLFTLIKEQGQFMYYANLSSNIGVSALENEVRGIIDIVYDLNRENFIFTLNQY